MLDRLTLDQLRVFVAVVETGSFSAAARRLNRVQSGVSQAVQTLEETLGVALFDRSARAPVATEAGAALVADARALLRDAERLKIRASSILEDTEPELSVAIDPILSPQVVTGALKGLAREFPDLPLTVFTEPLAGPEKRLRDGDARLAFQSWPGRTGSELESRFLISYPMVPVAAYTHPLSREPEPVPRAVMERHRQLVMTDGAPVSGGSFGVVSRDIWRFVDMPTRMNFLFNGFGWCHMPIHLVARAIVSGRLKHIVTESEDSYRIPIHAVNLVNRPLGRAGRWLVEEIGRRVEREWQAMPEVAPSLCAVMRHLHGDAALPVR